MFIFQARVPFFLPADRLQRLNKARSSGSYMVMLEFEGKSYRLKEAAARLAINSETS
jgi:hypothetical protein